MLSKPVLLETLGLFTIWFILNYCRLWISLENWKFYFDIELKAFRAISSFWSMFLATCSMRCKSILINLCRNWKELLNINLFLFLSILNPFPHTINLQETLSKFLSVWEVTYQLIWHLPNCPVEYQELQLGQDEVNRTHNLDACRSLVYHK